MAVEARGEDEDHGVWWELWCGAGWCGGESQGRANESRGEGKRDLPGVQQKVRIAGNLWHKPAAGEGARFGLVPVCLP